MAEEASFLGVIERLRAEGDLDRNRGNNSIKSLKGEVAAGNETIAYELDDISISTRVQADILHDLRDSILGNDLEKAEKEREQLSLLKSIAVGTNKPSKEKEKSEKKQSKGFFADLAVLFAPIGGFLAKFSPIFTKIGNIFGKSGTLSKIFGKGGSIAKFLPSLGRVLSKVAFPLTIAFGVFKGIVESIKGYKEGGIMGAIEGFFIGMFDGLIGDTLGLIGGLVEKLSGIFGLGDFGKMFNDSLANITDGIKGVFTGVFDAAKALFSGDTDAFKEALGKIWESIKTTFTGDGEGGGLLGILLNALKLQFVEIPKRIGGFLSDTLIPFLVEEGIPFLKEVVLPKLLEVGQNIGTVISEVFMDLINMIKEKALSLIPEPLKKAGSFLKKTGGFLKKIVAPAEKDGQSVMPVDPRYANAISAASRINKEDSLETDKKKLVQEDVLSVEEKNAVPESAAVPGVTAFSDDQQAVLEMLKDALADVDTDKERLEVAADFQRYKLQETNAGTEGLFTNDFHAEAARLFTESRNSTGAEIGESRNSTGAEMELGMSAIAEAKSQPATVIVSGGSSPQSTVVNNTTTTYNGSDHADESSILTRPMAYGF